MPRKKRTSDQPIGVGLTAKQFKRKKPVNADYLIDVEPLTDNQKNYLNPINISILLLMVLQVQVKTFITLYNALVDVMDETSPYERIYLVRSLGCLS